MDELKLMEEKQRENYKLVITGGVSGKTAIVDRFVNNRFPETYVPTQAKRNVEKTLIFKDFERSLFIWLILSYFL